MPTRMYRVNRLEGLVHELADGTELPGVPLESLTNGILSIQNGYLVSTQRDFAPHRIGTTGDAYLEFLNENHVQFVNTITERNINARTSSTTQYGLAGTIDVLTRSGDIRSIDIGFATPTPIGKSLMFHRNQLGQIEYVDVFNPHSTRQELLNELGPSYRFATGKESSIRAIMSYLKRYHENDIKEMLSNGDFASMGAGINTFSDALRYLANYGTANFTYQSRTVITLSPEVSE